MSLLPLKVQLPTVANVLRNLKATAVPSELRVDLVHAHLLSRAEGEGAPGALFKVLEARSGAQLRLHDQLLRA